MSAPSLLVVPPLVALPTFSLEAHRQEYAPNVVDPSSFAAFPDQDLARYKSVTVYITTAASSNAIEALSTVMLSRIVSMERLTFKLRFVFPNREETRRAWACIIGMLSSLKDFSAKTPITVFVEDAVPLAVIRASFSTHVEELNGLRRFLLGADKKLVTLIDKRIVDSVSFTSQPSPTRSMLEEDEVRLRSLFPALSDFGMLLFP